jgi:hypothetical protein
MEIEKQIRGESQMRNRNIRAPARCGCGARPMARAGMSRRNFLRGAGAAGLAGAAAMTFGARGARAATRRQVKIGIMTSLSVWPEGGKPQQDVIEYALGEQTKKTNTTFVPVVTDCTCGGDDPVLNPVQQLLGLKDQGCDFIVAPTCSGSAARMWLPPVRPLPEYEPAAWTGVPNQWVGLEDMYYEVTDPASTLMLSVGADSPFNEIFSQASRDYSANPNRPLAYRTITSSTDGFTEPLGHLICSDFGNAVRVALLAEDDSFAQGMSWGTKNALNICNTGGSIVYENTTIPMAGPQAHEAIKTAVTAAVNAGAEAIVFNPFGDTGANNVYDAVTDLYPTGVIPFAMYGSYSFIGQGVNNLNGMVLAAPTVDWSGVSLDWAHWRDPTNRSVDSLDTNLVRGYLKKMWRGYPDMVYDMWANWGDEYFLLNIADGVKFLTEAIIKHDGNVLAVNNELEHGTFQGYMGTISWNGNCFPNIPISDYIFYDVVGGEPVPRS